MPPLTRYSQQDPQWKSKLLGQDNESTLGSYGCLVTSMTMVCTAYGFNETPATLNDKMLAAGGFMGPLVMPRFIGKAVPGMRQVNYLECTNQPAPLTEIDAALAGGQPVIIELDYSPKEGLQNHWVVIYAKKGDDYLIQDPYPNPAETKEVTLTSRYGFAGKPEHIITKVLWLGGSGPVEPPKPPKLDTGVRASFKVYATADDLAIRSQTLVAETTLLKRVPMNTELTVLESDAAASAKIGQNNQWLAVKTADGVEGYTAAWYVARDKQAPATPPAKPAPSNAPVVKTTEEAVALRTKADTAATTLIKRLPKGAELKVLTPLEDARRRLGVVNEWLQVQDVQNTQGFVAAWYVVAVSGITALGVSDKKAETKGLSFSLGDEVLPVYLRAAQEGLALRTVPVITAETLIKRLPAEAELVALEAPDLAAPKIGQMGQWLHVRDVAGDEGYVAAWYVHERPEVPSGSGPKDA